MSLGLNQHIALEISLGTDAGYSSENVLLAGLDDVAVDVVIGCREHHLTRVKIPCQTAGHHSATGKAGSGRVPSRNGHFR